MTTSRSRTRTAAARSTRATTSTRCRSSTTPGRTPGSRTTTSTRGGCVTGSSASRATSGNYVLWFGPTPLIGDTGWATEAMLAMDRWLAAVEADTSNKPLAQKIVDDKPEDIADRCTATVCEQYLATRYETPRSVADGPLDGRRQQVPAEAARARGLPAHVHRRRLRAAAGDLPDGRLRLVEARRRPAGRHPVDDLPAQVREGGLRRPRATVATRLETGQTYWITLRIPSWWCMRSNPRLTSSRLIRCEMNESTSMSPAR